MFGDSNSLFDDDLFLPDGESIEADPLQQALRDEGEVMGPAGAQEMPQAPTNQTAPAPPPPTSPPAAPAPAPSAPAPLPAPQAARTGAGVGFLVLAAGAGLGLWWGSRNDSPVTGAAAGGLGAAASRNLLRARHQLQTGTTNAETTSLLSMGLLGLAGAGYLAYRVKTSER